MFQTFFKQSSLIFLASLSAHSFADNSLLGEIKEAYDTPTQEKLSREDHHNCPYCNTPGKVPASVLENTMLIPDEKGLEDSISMRDAIDEDFYDQLDFMDSAKNDTSKARRISDYLEEFGLYLSHDQQEAILERIFQLESPQSALENFISNLDPSLQTHESVDKLIALLMNAENY